MSLGKDVRGVCVTGVYTIPFDRAFLDDLAQGLLLQVAGDVAKLADYRILLPTNRSCKALRTAFLQANDGRPIILPPSKPLAILTKMHCYSQATLAVS